MGSFVSLAAGVALLYWPYVWCWYRKENEEDYGLRWDYDKRAILQTLLVSAIILALLTPAALWWPWDELPHRRGALVVFKMLGSGLAAAIIEETFFRGWVQPMFRKVMPAAAAIVLTNCIFAPIHLIAIPNPISLTVFFPGLVMGTLREKYGNVLPGMIFHFIGNIWAIWFFPAPINF